MAAFQFGSDQPQNKGTYGFPLPPNAQTRVAPPEWKSYKLITATTSTEVVPQNVYQMLVCVWGGGGSGVSATPAAGGGGGGAVKTGLGLNSGAGGAGGGGWCIVITYG